jgi:putative ABC transport system substrate-binding protein
VRAGKRKFIQLFGAAAAWPLAARAQAPKRIGILIPLSESDAEAQREIVTFRDELRQLGWPEGQAVRIDYRWGGGDFGRMRALARELVALKPDVIVCRTTPATKAVLEETRSIPIVFFVVSDPVGDGIVATLARPGGNVTGFTNVEASLGGKWLELLKEIAPSIARVGAIFNPKTAPGGGTYYMRLVNEAAAAMGVKVAPALFHDAAEIEQAIDALAREPNAALLVLPDGSNLANRKLIIATAARHRLPAMYPVPAFTVDGGLASYGVVIADLYRRGASYVDRILRGAKPSELPVQSPIKFELTINLKTAKTLGVSIPRSLLLRADKVID